MKKSFLMTSAVALTASLVWLGPALRAQSLTYTKGQNIAPAYEGWEQDADGSKWFLFGYMNRNWVEEIDVPVGPDNMFTPGGADGGQPTHFLPRRNRFVFRVRVPESFTETDELIWTLTSHGVTEKAWATLRPDYLLDNVAKMSETGALGAGTSNPELRDNQPPTVAVEGMKQLSATTGQPLTLTAVVKDDGIPKPPTGGNPLGVLFGGAAPAGDANGRGAGRGGGAPAAAPGGFPPALLAVFSGRGTPADLTAAAKALGVSEEQLQRLIDARRNPAMNPPARITVGKVNGLHLSWLVYRGAGAVTFSPEQIKPWEDTRTGMNSPWAPLWTPPRMPADGKIVVQATFARPGTYVLEALADDGGLLGSDRVTVTVTAGAPGAPSSSAAPAARPVAAASAGDLSGRWDLLLAVGTNELPIAATFKQEGGTISGTLTSPLGDMPVSGTRDGQSVTLAFTATTPQGALPVTMKGDLAADGTVTGTANLGALGEAGWTGKRAN